MGILDRIVGTLDQLVGGRDADQDQDQDERGRGGGEGTREREDRESSSPDGTAESGEEPVATTGADRDHATRVSDGPDVTDGFDVPESERDAREHVALARALAERGELAAAEERLRGLARRHPRLGVVDLGLGELAAKRGEDEAAVAAFGRACDREPRNPEAWFGLGQALARRGRFEPARDALRRALALKLPTALRPHAEAELGRLYAAANLWRKAVRLLRAAASALPDDPSVMANLGRALLASGGPEAAEGADFLARAARLPGGNVGFLLEAAAARAGEAWGGDGETGGAARRTGSSARALGRARAPATNAGASTTRDDDDEPAGLVATTAVPVNRAVAERLLREAVERSPADEVRPRLALARHLARSGRPAEGLPIALEARVRAPDDARVFRTLRAVHVAAGDFPAALVDADREASLGSAPPLSSWLALAFGARARDAIEALAARAETLVPLLPEDAHVREAATAWLVGRASPAQVAALARLAPDDDARRFVVHAAAPPPPPAGDLYGTLLWALELANHTPAFAGLAVPLARAAEAFDRPLLVAVMGEFNAGKSSFVNAWAGQGDRRGRRHPDDGHDQCPALRRGRAVGACCSTTAPRATVAPGGRRPFLAQLGDAGRAGDSPGRDLRAASSPWGASRSSTPRG